MGEYQFYEFRAVDSLLTIEDQAAIRQISSRVEPTRNRAIFIYHYSDFPKEPLRVLVQYFDAMLYLSNWGSKQLMFRFPKQAIELKDVQPYCIENCISFSTVGHFVVMNIEARDAGGGYWVEGEGWLDSLVRLREDILRQDYRALYLAWLKFAHDEGFLDTVPEPSLPPEVNKLTPALHDFIDLFEIDEFLVAVAAKDSSPLPKASEEGLQQAITKLSRQECHDFLARVLREEANLSIQLKRRLRELIDLPPVSSSPRRTVGELFSSAEEEREKEARRQAATVKEQQTQALLKPAQREPQAWQEVDTLIQTGNTRQYDEAVQLLIQLQTLARHQQTEPVFEAHLNRIYTHYSRRSALMKKLQSAGFSE